MKRDELIRPRGYIARPWWLGIIPKSVLPEAHKAVWCALADRLGENEEVWPNLHRVAFDSGIPYGDVNDAIDRLKALGLLTCRRSRSNRYVLLVPTPLKFLYDHYLAVRQAAADQRRDLTKDEMQQVRQSVKKALAAWEQELKAAGGPDINQLGRRGFMTRTLKGTSQPTKRRKPARTLESTTDRPLEGTSHRTLESTSHRTLEGTQTTSVAAEGNSPKERPQTTRLAPGAVAGPPLTPTAGPSSEFLGVALGVQAEHGGDHIPSASTGTIPPVNTFPLAIDEWDDEGDVFTEPDWEQEYEPPGRVEPFTGWVQQWPADTTPAAGPESCVSRVEASMQGDEPTPANEPVAVPDVEAAACASLEMMRRYLLHGEAGLERDADLTKLPPSKWNWLRFQKSPADPGLKRWKLDQYAGFFWFKVCQYRASHGQKLALPKWGRLYAHLKRLRERYTSEQLHSFICTVTDWFSVIRILSGGAGQAMTLTESSLCHRMIEMKVDYIHNMLPEDKADLWEEVEGQPYVAQAA